MPQVHPKRSFYTETVAWDQPEVASLKQPPMLHIGETDPCTAPEDRVQTADALGSIPLVSIRSYPEIGHAFARPGASDPAPQAADRANDRCATADP